MAGGSLPDTSDFRAVTGDDAVSISPSVQGLSPNASEAVHLADINRTIHGELYRSNANSFFQANDYLAPDLIKAAIGDVKGETALELYSGVGLFTLLLARRFSRVIAVESDNAAGEFARHNLTTADLHNAEVAIRDVGVWLDEVKRHELSKLSEKSATAIQSEIDFLLLDPPRTGAESRVIAGIIGLSPKRISYVSCDPATLARDLKKLIVGGYAVDTIAAFDMFPQTHHVETVVHLSRRPA